MTFECKTVLFLRRLRRPRYKPRGRTGSDCGGAALFVSGRVLLSKAVCTGPSGAFRKGADGDGERVWREPRQTEPWRDAPPPLLMLFFPFEKRKKRKNTQACTWAYRIKPIIMQLFTFSPSYRARQPNEHSPKHPFVETSVQIKRI